MDGSNRPQRVVLTLGWREWLGLPELGIRTIRAKVDSGARSSALHVEDIEAFRRTGVEWVRFTLQPSGPHGARQVCESAIVDRREVTDSGGHRTERIFIRTAIEIGPLTYPIEVNRASRANMLFPMLLGRTAMAGTCLVDPSASFLLGAQGSHSTPHAAQR
jgi:hypothetical protein